MKLRSLRGLAVAFACALSFAAPVQAAKLSLDTISAYLNGLSTAKGGFTQINDDGTIATGTIYIRRPGRVRFEYNPPERTLVMAGGGQVAIFDGKSNAPPEQYPLSRTPLNLILEAKVDLARRNMVVAHRSDDKTTTVVAQDPQHPDYGTIELVFTGNPVELRQWVITDAGGARTTVILGALERGGDLSSFLFNITAEAQSRGF